MGIMDEKAGMPTVAAFLCILFGAFASTAAPKRLSVREVHAETSAAAPFLSRPVAIVCDEGSVYVLDSADADIKIYSRDGAFKRTVGRRGQGPGEFRLPNDLDVLGGRLYVADSANRRLQILDAGGKHLGGFSLGLTPWRILVLSDDRILVAGLPSGRPPIDKIISCFRADGMLVWRAVDPVRSKDRIHDAVRNQVFIKRESGGGFRVVRSFDDRIIRTMNAGGFQTAAAEARGSGLPFRDIVVPTSGGKKKTVKGFCWSCAADGHRLYILSPEYTDDQDLGPGRVISVLGETTELEALIELPEKITKFAVAGDTIYAIDADARLRIFAIGGASFDTSDSPYLFLLPVLRPEIVSRPFSKLFPGRGRSIGAGE